MSLRVSVFGMTTCGKRVALWNRFVGKHKRVLVVDSLGEWTDSPVKGPRVDGIAETLWAIENQAKKSNEWRIFTCLTEQEISKLTQVLIPAKAYENSVVRALGGCALYLPEVDQQIQPNVYDRVRDLWRRGRHVGLSVYADTQSISSCSKETVKNVDILGMMATTHSTDLKVFEAEIRDPDLFKAATEWALRPYHASFWFPKTRVLSRVGPCDPKLLP